MKWDEAVVTHCEGHMNFRVWMRDPLGVLQEILDNPLIKDKVVWAPRKIYDSNNQRVYTDLYTSDWWWETQVLMM